MEESARYQELTDWSAVKGQQHFVANWEIFMEFCLFRFSYFNSFKGSDEEKYANKS